MRKTTTDNWTSPGSDAFTEKLPDVENEGACVNCGDYVPEYRKHFMDHYAAKGGEYGHYAPAYELGHSYAHKAKRITGRCRAGTSSSVGKSRPG